ncbi:virulence RhuM family protein [Bifidobacterium miconisargentati]|uniref:virulence RhuM family protein n=1 Tax=Bifidobacterium miconisargentati TaxID=2834437 RepID=UPI001BDC441C|nr:virulence RhuM family protein [Bifidobacterium miconisargentati]MBW3089903.1 virulence RhuM family protein [Bifidobacterium miconisargentati]
MSEKHDSENFDAEVEANIVLYQDDGRNVPVQVRYEDETFWLTQKAMAELFDVNVPNISKHLSHIYEEGELDEGATISKMEIVRQEGSRKVCREVAFYNLDAIIAVGYRVNSLKATRFRQWATKTLREYIIKGFVLNDDMLKNGRPFGEDYFDELLRRIRDIRASERRFYQKITDLFQDISVDYDPKSQAARDFFANVQNRFHYAVSGHTAAEIIDERVDADKPHMGLTTWKGAPEGKIHSSDVTVAKNYLSEDELSHLNQLVSGFLDAAELRVRNHQTTTMEQCIELCNQYILFTGGQSLQGKGTVSKKQADAKAMAEFRKFNDAQLSDFDLFVQEIERKR